MGYLNTHIKSECFGCEACIQVCGHNAIHMHTDFEGFRYPWIDTDRCVSCNMCRAVCPHKDGFWDIHEIKAAFGGYVNDPELRRESTSGGAFSAIAETWCQGDYAIFGAQSHGLEVSHSYVTDKAELARFRRSKYTQSEIGTSYADVKNFLGAGKRVLFSGTPCQIAGLKAFLGGISQENLLTVEVVCEGLPSPQFVQKYQEWLKGRYGYGIAALDYRNKDRPKWDFNIMKVTLEDGRNIYIDRWFNPFFTIWIGGLMSRPSCYGCPYTAQTGLADITLGDLWGVHQYCPELYGQNKGSSLVLCNTQKGVQAVSLAQKFMYGHTLDPNEVLKFQTRLRRPIQENIQREAFMSDLRQMDYPSLCKKWAKAPSFRLLWSKYVWGNRQKVFIWNLTHDTSSKWRKGRTIC